jgi:hypothetical protein
LITEEISDVSLEELESTSTRRRSSTNRPILPPNLFPLSSNSNSRLDSKPKLEEN